MAGLMGKVAIVTGGSRGIGRTIAEWQYEEPRDLQTESAKTATARAGSDEVTLLFGGECFDRHGGILKV